MTSGKRAPLIQPAVIGRANQLHSSKGLCFSHMLFVSSSVDNQGLGHRLSSQGAMDI